MKRKSICVFFACLALCCGCSKTPSFSTDGLDDIQIKEEGSSVSAPAAPESVPSSQTAAPSAVTEIDQFEEAQRKITEQIKGALEGYTTSGYDTTDGAEYITHHANFDGGEIFIQTYDNMYQATSIHFMSKDTSVILPKAQQMIESCTGSKMTAEDVQGLSDAFSSALMSTQPVYVGEYLQVIYSGSQFIIVIS